MKIVLNTERFGIINEFISYGKDNSVEIINAKSEKNLFDNIISSDVDAFIIESGSSYSQKAIDLIKKKHSYIPVVVIGMDVKSLNNGDIYIPFGAGPSFVFSCIKSIEAYKYNFEKLKKLTTQVNEVINIGDYAYDPTRRIFSYKDKKIKLSAKEGGIIEVLLSNFGEIVKREVILEKVWKKSDYFASRSMDVYFTHLRKMLKENQTSLTINNISGLGLILE